MAMHRERRWWCGAEVEQLIDLVGDDQEIVRLADGHELPASRRRHRGPRRILERRNGVEERGTMMHQRVLQRLDADALLVDRNADHLQAVIAKDLERQKIRRLFHENRVTPTRESGAHQIERLRGAG